MIYERERERGRERERERGEGKVQSLQERYMYRERIDFLGPLLWDTIINIHQIKIIDFQ